ncbi:type VI secretion-associated protein, ImpA family [compost metagenome]
MVDVHQLLNPVSPDAPCGDDLEYDPQFLGLERTAQGQPERQMGDSVLPAEPPDWREVGNLSEALLQRSKDLRIANFYLQSQIALDGFAGLARGLNLVSELLRQFWDHLYPVLDAADDNDPTFRINALAGISADPVIRLLWDAPLVRSRAFGSVTLRAALNAAGLQSFAGEHLGQEQVIGAFQNAGSEQVGACLGSLALAQDTLQAIERDVNERVGSERGADLRALKQLLRHALQIARDQSPAGTASDASGAAQDTAGAAEAPTGSAPQRASGEISSREDVVRSLDRILAYYSRHEPSSPVPVLLARAKRLVAADFATIVRDLIPDGFSQFEAVRGRESE